MWIVRYALAKPYSVAALALLIVLAGTLSYARLAVDVLPSVDIPSVKVVWTYSGLNSAEMAAKVTTFGEVAIMNNVDNIREVKSQTINGVGIIRVQFQPDVQIGNAMAQITAISQTILRRLPPGTVPPLIVQYSQSSTPIMQLVISSDTLNDSQLADFGRLNLRSQVQTISGIRMTTPYGGAFRQLMLDLKPDAMYAYGVTAADIGRALDSQNVTLPSGNVREGDKDIAVALNASPEAVAAFETIPVKVNEDRLILLRDVADVRDGGAMQSNIARVNGSNAVIVSLIKLGNASTLEIIGQVMALLPQIQAAAPEALRIEPIFDQSVFVQLALFHIQTEILIVGSLVALIVLLFLGSGRATLIVLTSIPLSLLSAVFILRLSGNTLNLMSLGGLALAIGILVDNALVEIENIKTNLAKGLAPRAAALRSAQQVAFAEFVSTISICIVFSPIFFLSGVSGYIFKPLAIVVTASLAMSYLLSRTVVPVLAMLLLSDESEHKAPRRGPLQSAHRKVEAALNAGQRGVAALVGSQLSRPWIPLAVVLVLVGGALTFSSLGRDFFPKMDAGLLRFYLRAEPGLRIEETALVFADIQREIRTIIPAHELESVVEIIGSPEPVNIAWVDSFAVGSFDGELLIQLTSDHSPTVQYEQRIRRMMAEKFPSVVMFAQPADTTNLTLAGPTPTALDVEFVGRDVQGNLALARALVESLSTVPGAVDVGLQQVLGLPQYFVSIDRERAARLGIDVQETLRNVLAALGSGGSVNPSYWTDPNSGFGYAVQAQAPMRRLNSIDTVMNLQIPSHSGAVPLSAFATVTPRLVPASIGRMNLQPTVNVLLNVENSDLGSVYREVDAQLRAMRAQLKPGNSVSIRGQAEAMVRAYDDLFAGFFLGLFFIYIVMLFNFASWRLPLVALGGVPVAISGAAFGLALTQTTLSVPALMGFIMVIGVSTANSVLVTSFARDLWLSGMPAERAARKAAAARLRPVLMTALTMILGLTPMALALGQGAEQNAPLARAVIGGLLLGTLASLIFIPWLFARVMRGAKRPELALQAVADEKERAYGAVV
jgi:multidrug efflux pump subunit AcrB